MPYKHFEHVLMRTCRSFVPMLRYLPVLLFILPVLASAQIPIVDARSLPIGTNVTVNGIVTNGSEFGSIRYMQDGTAGIAVFPGAGSIGGFSPAPGSDITVSGTLKLFNGLLEIDPVLSFTVNSTGNPLPTPITITPAQINEAHESRLVRVNGASFSDPGSIFTSTTWPFTSGGENAVIYVRTSNPLIGTNVPFGQVDIVGIVSQFTPDQPPDNGYQLLPRGPGDLMATSGIFFTSAVEQSAIMPDGFTLSWTTNVNGSSGVDFGLTEALGQQIVQPENTTTHAVQLEGLDAATFYYTRAWSVLGNDTAYSPIGIYSTASTVPGDILVYFNKTVDHSVAIGPLAIDLDSAIDDTIRAYIDRAEATIDAAVYNTTNNSIVHALNDAVNRGVQVRYIAEGSTNNSALETLPTFPVHYRMNSSGSGMHNKFLVIDADLPELAFTITGSTNFTNTSFFFDANNVVIVKDQSLARAHVLEFEEMWGSSDAMPDPVNSRFGADKTDNTPHLFNVNGTVIESRFSPSDGTTSRITHALRSADQHIEFALFALTLDDLTDELIEMHNMPGVTVRGVLDDGESGSWDVQQLLNAQIEVLLDDADDSQLHHKYAIVDRGQNDAVVITGSHNWSFNAEVHNDENTLFIHSADIADQFYQEWHARWTTAVNITEENSDATSLRIWPNPTRDVINIQTGSKGSGFVSIEVIDASGRRMLQQNFSQLGTVQVDVTTLAQGAYLLMVENDGAQSHHVLVRE